MTFADWNHGLLLATVLIVMGMMLLVSASAVRGRLIGIGVLSQGILIAFVASGSFYGRSGLLLAALALVALVGLWSLLVGDLLLGSDTSDSSDTPRATSCEPSNEPCAGVAP